MTIATASAADRSMLDDLFVAEHRGRYLLHAPLHEVSCLVNRSMYDELSELIDAGGSVGAGVGSELRPELERVGLSAELAMPPPRSTGPDRSAEMTLFLTEQCNLRCVYCYARGGEGCQAMAPELADAALRLVVETAAAAEHEAGRAATVHLHGGGEVTQAWQALCRAVEHGRDLAERRDVTIRFTAGLNGVMSEPRASYLAQVLDEATISIDGLPELHDANRPMADGRGSSEAVQRSLEVFDHYRARYGLRVTVTSRGIEDLPRSIEHLVRVSNARVIQVEPVSMLGRGHDLSPVDPHRFVARFREAGEVASAWGRVLRYSGARYPLLTDVFCKAPLGAICLSPDGRVTSCFEAGDASDRAFGFGGWDSVRRRLHIDPSRRRRLLGLSVHHLHECRGCICRWHCAGDCPMKRLSGAARAGGRCVINQELTKDQILHDLEVGS